MESTIESNNLNTGKNYRPDMENDLSFKGVLYKQFYFANPKDVESWLRSNLSQPNHGLFVDIVSFSEFFGKEKYTEDTTTLNKLYMSNRIGYATTADSVVATSFQNILPGAYGRSPESDKNTSTADMDAQQELPGLPTYKTWDRRDGRSGRRFWIKKETRDTERKIDG